MKRERERETEAGATGKIKKEEGNRKSVTWAEDAVHLFAHEGGIAGGVFSAQHGV